MIIFDIIWAHHYMQLVHISNIPVTSQVTKNNQHNEKKRQAGLKYTNIELFKGVNSKATTSRGSRVIPFISRGTYHVFDYRILTIGDVCLGSFCVACLSMSMIVSCLVAIPVSPIGSGKLGPNIWLVVVSGYAYACLYEWRHSKLLQCDQEKL